jgi:Family of unknown function (DUF5977)
MPYTFANMAAALQPILWPTGEQQNLIVPHRALMVEALVDLQIWCECLQVNNVNVNPQCNTLFKCGWTVMDAPRGKINRLYTLDQVNQTTGLEDPTVPTDWCSLVEYRQVEYADLQRLESAQLAKTNLEFWNWWGLPGALSGIIAFPACWATKYATYPPPTDAGLSGAPALPLGYHYAQTSTDQPNGIRAQFGMWAIKGGQIFVAPWIQSTETIVIEWDGIKRTWNDTDLVDDDPNLLKAVEWYVRWQQALKYDHDYEQAQAAVNTYNEARAVLIETCRQENAVRDAASGVNSKARGAAQVVPTFSNNAQTATAQCPAGTTGAAVSYTVPQGTIVVTTNQADADAQALSLALQTAGQQLQCVTPPTTYFNTAQSFTATCTGGTGSPSSVSIPANTYSSIISQADANQQALNAAQSAAQAALQCSFTNTAQSYTATCPAGSTGSPVTITVAAGTITSQLSQADANAQALASATNQANAQLTCSIAPTVYYNTVQTVTLIGQCTNGHLVVQSSGNVRTTVTVAAGAYSSLVSQSAANTAALQYAQATALQQLQAQCPAGGSGVTVGTGGGGGHIAS